MIFLVAVWFFLLLRLMQSTAPYAGLVRKNLLMIDEEDSRAQGVQEPIDTTITDLNPLILVPFIFLGF